MKTLEARLAELKNESWFEALLVQHAREYGHGKADNLDYGSRNILDKLCVHAGYMPPSEPVRAPIRTEADRLESIYQDLEKTDYYKHIQILLIDYYLPNNTIEMRLTRLNKIGIKISSSGYFCYLKVAKELVKSNL